MPLLERDVLVMQRCARVVGRLRLQANPATVVSSISMLGDCQGSYATARLAARSRGATKAANQRQGRQDDSATAQRRKTLRRVRDIGKILAGTISPPLDRCGCQSCPRIVRTTFMLGACNESSAPEPPRPARCRVSGDDRPPVTSHAQGDKERWRGFAHTRRTQKVTRRE